MSSIPREALKTSASKPGVIVVASSALNSPARAITSCGSEISAGVILFITSIAVEANLPLAADVEDLKNALRIGGDAREVGAIKYRALQGARLEQRLFRLLARGVIGADQHVTDDGV